jgi:hypothetical protein
MPPLYHIYCGSVPSVVCATCSRPFARSAEVAARRAENRWVFTGPPQLRPTKLRVLINYVREWLSCAGNADRCETDGRSGRSPRGEIQWWGSNSPSDTLVQRTCIFIMTARSCHSLIIDEGPIDGCRTGPGRGR